MAASKKTRFDGVVVYPRVESLDAGDPLDTAKVDVLWNNIHAIAACNTSQRYNLQASEAIPTAGSATGIKSGRLTLYPTTGFVGFPSADVLTQDTPFLLHRAALKVNLDNDTGKPMALDIKVKLASYTALGTGTFRVYFHFGRENVMSGRTAGTWRPATDLGLPDVKNNVLFCNIASTAATSTDMTLYRYGTTSTVSNIIYPEVENVSAYLERSSHVGTGTPGENEWIWMTYLTIWVVSNKDMGSTSEIYLDGLTIREIPYS